MALPFEAGGFETRADYGFVSAMDLHKPQFDNELGKRYGNQYLSEFLMNINYAKPVMGYEYFHFEEGRIYPKLNAKNSGAGSAGAAVTFTLASNAKDSYSLGSSPFVGSTSENITSARKGDIISIKPASGVVNSSSMILARVQSVDTAAGTFVAIPLETGVAIPSIPTDTEIAIVGNAFGEGDLQPESRASKVSKYSNNVQFFKETFELPGTAKGLQTWVEFTGANGQKGKYFVLKGEEDAYVRFLNTRELGLLTNKKTTNVTLANAQAAAGTPTLTTEGLIPFIQSQGNNLGYSALTGFSKADMDEIVVTLDSQKGAKENLFMCGIQLSLAIDDVLADSRQNGAVTFGAYSFGADASINYQFDSYKIGNYIFKKKTMESFNDLQSLGAQGYGYPFEGMIIPMDAKMDSKTGEKMSSLRVRYLVDENGTRLNKRAYVEGFSQFQDGKDIVSMRYSDAVGFQGIGGNRFFYIERV